MWNKFINYLKETRQEMRKVNWPTRSESVRFTLIVVAVSLGIALLLGAFDFIFTSLLKLII